MNKIEPVTKCPKCYAAGKLIKDYGRIAHYQCPACDHEWTTLTR